MYSKFKNHSKWSPLKIVGMVIGGITFAAGLALLFGWVVMLLWNWLMPEIFDLGVINYWQAVGLIILAKLIFGFGGGDHSSKKNKHHSGPKGFIKEESKENFNKWHHYEGFWKEKGKKAFSDYVDEKEVKESAYEDIKTEEKAGA